MHRDFSEFIAHIEMCGMYILSCAYKRRALEAQKEGNCAAFAKNYEKAMERLYQAYALDPSPQKGLPASALSVQKIVHNPLFAQEPPEPHNQRLPRNRREGDKDVPPLER